MPLPIKMELAMEAEKSSQKIADHVSAQAVNLMSTLLNLCQIPSHELENTLP